MNTFRHNRKKKRKSLSQLKEEFKVMLVAERKNLRAGRYYNSRPAKMSIDIVPQ